MAHEIDNLTRRGVSSQPLLGEDEVTVERHLEAAVGGWYELDGLDDRCPTAEKLVRQTDGTGNIVSRDTEVDEEPVPRIEHGALLFASGVAARLTAAATTEHRPTSMRR